MQKDDFYKVVSIRWKAIEYYFLGDVESCINYLNKALLLAKETKQPNWLIYDILIDLRNQHWENATLTNTYSDSEAQEELDGLDENIYYPVLDRINESLQEKYIQGLYKKKTDSPYSVTLGNNFNQYGELLASSLIVSIFNGSLTHILLFYKRVKEFLFYLTSKYDDWNLKKELLKFAVFEGNEKEVRGLLNSYPEILKNLSENDADK